jgi:hypothetical protein
VGKRTRTAAAVGGAVLLLALAAGAVAAWRAAQPGLAAYRVSLRAVPATESADWSAQDTGCPPSGRGEGPIGADDSPIRAVGSSPQQIGAGQLLAYHVRFDADPTAPALGDLATDIHFRATSPESPIDLSEGILCAFVDDSDPLTTATDARATLGASVLDEQQRTVSAPLQVTGLESGASAVVEVWVQAAADQPRSTAVVEASLGSVTAPPGSRARVTIPESRLITSSQQSRDVQIELLGPSANELQPGQDIRLTMRLRNRASDIAREIVAELAPDAAIEINDIEVHDEAGTPTTCEQAGAVVSCTTAYLVPSERVTVDVDATIGQDAPQVFNGSGITCSPNAQDLCARADLVSLGGGSWLGQGAELAMDLPAPNVLGATKVTADSRGGLYVGRYGDFQYIVALGSDVPVQDVKVTDPSCAPVILISGDEGADAVLSAGERWTFTCSALVDLAQLAEVAVTATTADGEDVKAVARLGTRILDPELALTNGGSGDEPELEVLNSGNAELTSVVIVGRGCEAEAVRGDANDDGVLDPSERWIFPCRSASGAVRAYGTDPAGGAVTAALGP